MRYIRPEEQEFLEEIKKDVRRQKREDNKIDKWYKGQPAVDVRATLEKARRREAAGYELPGHTEKMKEHLKEHQQPHWKQD